VVSSKNKYLAFSSRNEVFICYLDGNIPPKKL